MLFLQYFFNFTPPAFTVILEKIQAVKKQKMAW